MESRELQEIKARAEHVRKLLGNGSDTQHLIENDLPKLVAEVERLTTDIGQAGKCPHGDSYKDRTCVECFGDGTEEMRECSECRTKTWHRGGKCLRHDASAPKPYEALKTELKKLQGEIQTVQEQSSAHLVQAEERVKETEIEAERLREELEQSGLCPHQRFYEDRSCVECFGDGTEKMRECSECGTKTWHRGGKCLSHDASAPRPYEPLRTELKKLQGEIQTVQEQSSARVAQAEERAKEVEAICVVMREALEYVKARIGSSNIGESMIKIDRALSSSSGNRTIEDNKGTG
jgi:Skp family chaperone for outer membrane proteins